MTAVLVILGSGWSAGGSSVLAGDASLVQSYLAKGATVSVVSFGLPGAIPGVAAHRELSGERPPLLDRVARSVGLFTLRDRLSRSPIGRLLNSLGPVDQGRVVRRAVRADAEASRMLREADVVIAADLAGVATAWTAVRRGVVPEARYDHRSVSIAAGSTAAGLPE